jgi:hypothetical protein
MGSLGLFASPYEKLLGSPINTGAPKETLSIWSIFYFFTPGHLRKAFGVQSYEETVLSDNSKTRKMSSGDEVWLNVVG